MSLLLFILLWGTLPTVARTNNLATSCQDQDGEAKLSIELYSISWFLGLLAMGQENGELHEPPGSLNTAAHQLYSVVFILKHCQATWCTVLLNSHSFIFSFVFISVFC